MAKAADEPAATGGELVEQGELTPEQKARMDELSQEMKGEIDLQNDVRIPSLMLVQKTSKSDRVGDAKPGHLVHSQTLEDMARAEVVLCRMYKTRTYWGRQEGLNNPPACSSQNALDGWGDPDEETMKRDSDDGVTVIPYGQKLAEKGPNGGGKCASCPKNGIGDNRCQLQYNYFAVLTGENGDGARDINMALPVAILMKRTSVKIANQVNSLLLQMPYPWSNVFELWGEEETNRAGQEYYVWRVKKGRPATMAEMVRAAEVAGLVSEAQKAGTLTVEGDEGVDADKAADEASKKDEDIPF